MAAEEHAYPASVWRGRAGQFPSGPQHSCQYVSDHSQLSRLKGVTGREPGALRFQSQRAATGECYLRNLVYNDEKREWCINK